MENPPRKVSDVTKKIMETLGTVGERAGHTTADGVAAIAVNILANSGRRLTWSICQG